MAQQGLTLEQLQSMGAKPVTSPVQNKGGGLSLEQLQSMGAKPVQSQKSYIAPVEKGIFTKAVEGTKELAKGFVKGAGESLQNLGNAALSVPKKVIETITPGGEIKTGISSENFVARNRAQEVGKILERVGEFVAPVGKVGAATKTLSIIPRILSRGAVDTAISLNQTGGDVGSSASTGLTTAVGEGVSSALPGGKVTGSVSKLLRTLAPGYATDVSMGLTGQRGEDRTGTNAFIPGMGTAVSPVFAGVGKAIEKGVERVKTAPQRRIEELKSLLGKVGQGENARDSERLMKAIQSVDTSNVKTYQEGVDLFNKKVAEMANKKGEVLNTKVDTYTMDKLGTRVTSGKTTKTHNFVSDSLDQLDEFYAKTNRPADQARIAILRDKAETKGLTVKEIDDIAVEHGQELNAYNANGQLASGLTKQSAENTRKGLKTTARSLFGDESYAQTDEQISDLIKAREMFQDIADKVTELQQKVQTRGLGERVGRALGKVINTVGLGSPKGLIESFLSRGTGLKTLNALDLQEMLQKNLSKIKKIIDSDLPENTLIQRLEEIIDKSKAPKLALPAPGDSSYSVNQGRPIPVAPTGRQIETTSADVMAQSTSATQPIQSNMNKSNIANTVTRNAKTVKLDRRQQLINQLRGEYEPYVKPEEMPVIQMGEKNPVSGTDASNLLAPNVYSPKVNVNEPYTDTSKLPVIEMGTVPKKKVTGKVINADKMTPPNVSVPEKTQTSKVKNPVSTTLETSGKEKRVILDLWADPEVKGKGITKDETLKDLKAAYSKGHDIIEPSNGMWTREGKGFIENLKETGYIKKIENRGGIERYQVTDKIKDYKYKNIINNSKVSEVLKTQSNKVQNLELEAKKYKSAKEFVKSQLDKNSFVTKEPIKIYRGEGKGIGNTTLVNGKYFAGDKKFAETFGDVTEDVIPAGTKIFDLDNIKNGSDLVNDTTLVDVTKLTDFLIDNGFEYTKNTNSRGVEYVNLKPTLKSITDKNPIENFKKFDDRYRDLADTYKTFNSFYSAVEKRADETFAKTGKFFASNRKMLKEYFEQIKSNNIPKSSLSKENTLEEIWKKANNK